VHAVRRSLCGARGGGVGLIALRLVLADNDGGGLALAGARAGVYRIVPGEGGASSIGVGSAPAILIVEDDYIVASELCNALNDAGFDVVGVADNADQAIELARSGRPALAVVDIRLFGRRDGVDAATDMARTLGVRSIFATAHHDPATQARGRAANPLGWLHKPYTMEAAVVAVKAALAELRKPS
jgi:CheY-like chemotaxis protein